MPDVRAIDCWVNVSVGSSRERAPDYALRTAEGYFKRSKDFFKTFSANELVAIMDQVGVEKAIVTLPAENPSEKILAFPKAYPGRTRSSSPPIILCCRWIGALPKRKNWTCAKACSTNFSIRTRNGSSSRRGTRGTKN